MSDLFKKAISLGWGLTIVSKEKIERTVEDLVQRGELAPAESRDLIDRLVERGEEEKAQFKDFLREQIQRVLTELHVPTEYDVTSLEQRIATLEKRISELEVAEEKKVPETDIVTDTL
ncbi:polyhydroxyalkanoate synthesis regulator [Paenibacillus sp. KQZ6P-2]|uniref:Polyhydroxyalkanoate synthesis regulator n=1 Tax=Paenibacillus mangrovi TaxID=2931978 RepID=A0A9X2B6K8_9BACL|nr:polyhydroxyalkanoate synthesis regulator [Paenibacillus mangrovi]MCJ8012843.1 polyhydroxyalkanoate synthesis regulator [Paenibacillus mangrovi]